ETRAEAAALIVEGRCRRPVVVVQRRIAEALRADELLPLEQRDDIAIDALDVSADEARALVIGKIFAAAEAELCLERVTRSECDDVQEVIESKRQPAALKVMAVYRAAVVPN